MGRGVHVDASERRTIKVMKRSHFLSRNRDNCSVETQYTFGDQIKRQINEQVKGLIE